MRRNENARIIIINNSNDVSAVSAMNEEKHEI